MCYKCMEADVCICLNLFQFYLFQVELKTGKEPKFRKTLSRQSEDWVLQVSICIPTSSLGLWMRPGHPPSTCFFCKTGQCVHSTSGVYWLKGNIWISVICTNNKGFALFQPLSVADTCCVYRYVQRFLLPAELIAAYLFMDHRGINLAWVYQEEKQSAAVALSSPCSSFYLSASASRWCSCLDMCSWAAGCIQLLKPRFKERTIFCFW